MRVPINIEHRVRRNVSNTKQKLSCSCSGIVAQEGKRSCSSTSSHSQDHQSTLLAPSCGAISAVPPLQRWREKLKPTRFAQLARKIKQTRFDMNDGKSHLKFSPCCMLAISGCRTRKRVREETSFAMCKMQGANHMMIELRRGDRTVC